MLPQDYFLFGEERAMDRDNCDSEKEGLVRVGACSSLGVLFFCLFGCVLFYFVLFSPLSGQSGHLTSSTSFAHTKMMISQAGSSISCHFQEMKSPLLTASIEIVGCQQQYVQSSIILKIECQAPGSL